MAELKGIRSLEVIQSEVRAERTGQLANFDSIDTKAGILLGFAGALVALSRGSSVWPITIGRGLGALSGFLSLWTFWPRRFWNTDLRPFRDKYLAAEPAFSNLKLLDTHIEMAERMAEIIRRKATTLRLAMVALALAVLLTAVGLGLD
jgi:hypothetical protein